MNSVVERREGTDMLLMSSSLSAYDVRQRWLKVFQLVSERAFDSRELTASGRAMLLL